ncbi:amidohydrolase family protein [Agrococcus sp. 1P02AA]|uniref:amidohydrolase n=1 Tax=Agrococcus sp. 1P02AA TaxID=3132259 RepID=UPI0039A5A315
MSASLLLRDASVDGARVDVLVRDGAIAEIGQIDARTADVEQVHLDGRVLLPGLWDNHVHMSQWALHAKRPSTFHATSAREAAGMMAAALASAGALPLDEHGRVLPLVGTGFRDGLWSDLPSRDLLDEAVPGAPAVVVSADLHAVWLNSRALERFGLGDHPTGVLREEPAFEIEGQINDLPPEVLDAWVVDAGRDAAARGVVGIVDLEMAWNADTWMRRLGRGWRSQRVELGIYPQHLERAIELGMRTGDALDALLSVGRLKIITDGSLGTRTAYCFDPYPGMQGAEAHGLLAVPPAELEALVLRGLDAGIAPTVHAIGDHANAHVLDVFERLGIRGSAGRIEHAQLLRAADVARLGALGVDASVQPEHAMDDRDLADRHWHGRTDGAFLVRSLLEAGATLALGSDAPVAPLDPWVSMAAAVERAKDGREPWHPAEAIDVADALRASVRSRVAVGEPADLVALDADPIGADGAALRAMPVALTLLAGRPTHTTL